MPTLGDLLLRSTAVYQKQTRTTSSSSPTKEAAAEGGAARREADDVDVAQSRLARQAPQNRGTRYVGRQGAQMLGKRRYLVWARRRVPEYDRADRVLLLLQLQGQRSTTHRGSLISPRLGIMSFNHFLFTARLGMYPRYAFVLRKRDFTPPKSHFQKSTRHIVNLRTHTICIVLVALTHQTHRKKYGHKRSTFRFGPYLHRF